jgi:translocation and assembly module TamB
MKWVLRGAVVVVALALLLAGALWWVAGSDAGLRWSAHMVQTFTHGQLQIDAARGALIGGSRFDRIRYQADGTTIEATGVQLRIDPGAIVDRTFVVDSLHIDRLVVMQGPPTAAHAPSAPSLPKSIALPVEVRVGAATIDTLEIQRADTTSRVSNFFVSYEGGAQRHKINSLRADLGFGHVGAAGSIGTTRPFAIDVAAALDRPGNGKPPATPLDATTEVWVHLGGSLENLSARARGSLAQIRAEARAELTPFERQWPESLRSLEASAAPIDIASFFPGAPHTVVSLQLNARGNGQRLNGEVQASNAQAGPLEAKRLPVRSVSAQFATDLTSATLERFAIALAPGGSLCGSGALQASPLAAHLDVIASGLDLRALGSTLRATALDGPLHVDVNGPQQQTLSGALAERDLRVAARLQRSGDLVDITELQLAARGGAASASGRLQLATPARVDAKVQFKRFDPARFGAFPTGDINGNADVTGTLGPTKRIEASWNIANSKLRGRPLASHGAVRVAGEEVEKIDAVARLGTNELSARGAFGRTNDRLQWRVNAPALAELADELGGQLQASGTISGTTMQLRAELQADAKQLRAPGGVGVQSIHLEGHGGTRPDAPFAIRLTAQQIATSQITLDRVVLDATGTRARHDAHLQAKAQARSLDLSVRGAWSGQWPGKWVGELATATLHGALPGNATVQVAAPAAAAVAADDVSVNNLRLLITGDDMPQADLRVDELHWQPGRLATRGGFEHLSTRWLAAFVELPPGMETTVALAGTWSIRSDPRLNGALSIKRESGDVRVVGPPALEAGLSDATLEARFEEGRITSTLVVNANVAKVQAHASIAPESGAAGFGITPQAPVTFSAQLDVAEMRLISEPLQTFARVTGRVAANLQGSGTLGTPHIEGSLTADSLGVIVPPYGVELQDGRIRAQLSGDTLQISELTIRGGDGRFTASGTLPLRPDAGRGDLTWHAQNFRLLNRPDMRLVVSADGNVGVARQRVAVRGEVRAERGHFEFTRTQLPKPGDDVAVQGQEPRKQQAAVHTPLDLDLWVDLGKELTLRGGGLDGKATGRIHLANDDAGELRVEGKVQAVNAKFRAYGQELEVDPGNLVFGGPIDNPTLDITAWRRHQQVEAGVQLSGTAKAPLVTLVSSPNVPEGERLSWLVLGRAPNDANGQDLALLQAAAGVMLGGGDAVPMNQKIANSLGLDELAVRSSSEISSNVVALGKRLSDRVLVTYEHGLGGAAENLVQLNFSLTRRISLRAETGSTTGLGIFYRFAWD